MIVGNAGNRRALLPGIRLEQNLQRQYSVSALMKT